jgi:hypothetical protein
MGNERQKHGFEYERQMIAKYGLLSMQSYTAKHDAFCGTYPVQVKCIKYGCAVELGDYKRNKYRTQSFILIIGLWKDNKSNIVAEHIIVVEYDDFVKHLHYDYDDEIENGMKRISNSRDDDAKWEKFCKVHKGRWPKSNLIDIRFKRDHKTQKRVQCAISWKIFNDYFLRRYKKLNGTDLKAMQYMSLTSTMPQTTGLLRNTRDEYFTKPELAAYFANIALEKIELGDNDLFIEPSAGEGAFIDALAQHLVFGYDISSKRVDVVEHDFLDIDHSMFHGINCHAIGNPPFGRQSSLAKKFIRKCAMFCSSISFILPKSFKKDSFQNTLPLDFHLIFEEDCPDNSFLVEGKEHDVPCVFQVWIKRSVPRTTPSIQKPLLYGFVEKHDAPDISFRRVGVNAGEIDIHFDDKSMQSHNFIKFDNSIDVNQFLKLYSIDVFQHNNTVGPRSIAKTEMIRVFNEIINQLHDL